MNKPLIITIAAGVLLLALGSWMYLFFYGAPQSPDEFFTDLGITPDSQGVVPSPLDGQNETGLLAIDGSPLQQLTLRPVAGFVALPGSIIRYAEQGTGHVYDINTISGQEERISNTTIPQTQQVVFSETGEQLVLQAFGDSRRTTMAIVETDSLNTRSLPPNAMNVVFLGTSTVAYTLPTNQGTTGYQYNIDSESQVIDFVVPFISIHTHYTADQTYVSNRHAPELIGALWEVSGTAFTQVGSEAYGLVVETGPRWYATAFTQNNTYLSQAINWSTGEATQLPVSFIPEKCDWGTQTLWCAAPAETVSHTYLKNWYQGTIRANDMLWRINPTTETAELLIDPLTSTGRQLDITNLTQAGIDQLLFTNRNDNSLWLYDGSLE